MVSSFKDDLEKINKSLKCLDEHIQSAYKYLCDNLIEGSVYDIHFDYEDQVLELHEDVKFSDDYLNTIFGKYLGLGKYQIHDTYYIPFHVLLDAMNAKENDDIDGLKQLEEPKNRLYEYYKISPDVKKILEEDKDCLKTLIHLTTKYEEKYKTLFPVVGSICLDQAGMIRINTKPYDPIVTPIEDLIAEANKLYNNAFRNHFLMFVSPGG